MKPQVTAVVKPLSVNDEEVSVGTGSFDLQVKSHWAFDDRVILLIDGKNHEFFADDLESAIESCTVRRRG